MTMIDANATSGSRDDVHVFEFDDVDSPNTPLLRDFMSNHLCAHQRLLAVIVASMAHDG